MEVEAEYNLESKKLKIGIPCDMSAQVSNWAVLYPVSHDKQMSDPIS
jgi:hypothetical protein